MRFLAQCRSNGMLDITDKDCVRLRDAWFKAFPEMVEFMKPEAMLNEAGKQVFCSKTITGRCRANCSFCSALNFTFQGLASDGAKYAGYELMKQGFRDSLINFIH